jgi:hypothetical protein
MERLLKTKKEFDKPLSDFFKRFTVSEENDIFKARFGIRLFNEYVNASGIVRKRKSRKDVRCSDKFDHAQKQRPNQLCIFVGKYDNQLFFG